MVGCKTTVHEAYTKLPTYSKTTPLGGGLGRNKLVRLNKVQPVLSQIYDYRPLSVKALLQLAKFNLN